MKKWWIPVIVIAVCVGGVAWLYHPILPGEMDPRDFPDKSFPDLIVNSDAASVVPAPVSDYARTEIMKRFFKEGKPPASGHSAGFVYAQTTYFIELTGGILYTVDTNEPIEMWSYATLPHGSIRSMTLDGHNLLLASATRIDRFGLSTLIAGQNEPFYQVRYCSYDLNEKTSSKISGRTYWAAFSRIRTIS